MEPLDQVLAIWRLESDGEDGSTAPFSAAAMDAARAANPATLQILYEMVGRQDLAMLAHPLPNPGPVVPVITPLIQKPAPPDEDE